MSKENYNRVSGPFCIHILLRTIVVLLPWHQQNTTSEVMHTFMCKDKSYSIINSTEGNTFVSCQHSMLKQKGQQWPMFDLLYFQTTIGFI